MISSKSKSSVAYAKTCKDKSSIQLLSNQIRGLHRSSQDKTQNICDELIKDLPSSQTGYISQLLNKQERKMIKDRKIDNKSQQAFIFQNRLNQNIGFSPSEGSQQLSKNKQRGEERVSLNKNVAIFTKQANFCGSQVSDIPSQKENLFEKTFIEKPQVEEKWSFVNNITDYLSILNQQDSVREKQSKKNSSIQQCESYRESDNKEDGMTVGRKWVVSSQKYNQLLNQLEKTLIANDALEEKVETQERKIQEMSKIIGGMCCEMEKLKQKLRSEHKQKEKYQVVLQDFMAKLQHTKSKSKSKSFVPHHLKRFSHVPSSQQLSDDFKLSTAELKSSMKEKKCVDSRYLNKFKDENVCLKKKGKPERFKIKDVSSDEQDNDPIEERPFFRKPFHQ